MKTEITITIHSKNIQQYDEDYLKEQIKDEVKSCNKCRNNQNNNNIKNRKIMNNITIKKEVFQLTQLIILYAKKAVAYPKNSKGYDPVDMVNLEYVIKKYDEWLIKDAHNFINPKS